MVIMVIMVIMSFDSDIINTLDVYVLFPDVPQIVSSISQSMQWRKALWPMVLSFNARVVNQRSGVSDQATHRAPGHKRTMRRRPPYFAGFIVTATTSPLKAKCVPHVLVDLENLLDRWRLDLQIGWSGVYSTMWWRSKLPRMPSWNEDIRLGNLEKLK